MKGRGTTCNFYYKINAGEFYIFCSEREKSSILFLWISKKLVIMHKLRVEEWLVSAVISMSTGEKKTFVTTVYSNSKCF